MAWCIRPAGKKGKKKKRLQSDAIGLCAARDGREECLAFSRDTKSSHKPRDTQFGDKDKTPVTSRKKRTSDPSRDRNPEIEMPRC